MGMAVELFVQETLPLQRFLDEALGFEVEQAEAGFVAMHRDEAAVYLRHGFDGLGEDHPFVDAPGKRLGLGVEVVLDAVNLEHAHRTAVAMDFGPTPITAAPWGGADFRLAVPDGFYLRIRERRPS